MLLLANLKKQKQKQKQFKKNNLKQPLKLQHDGSRTGIIIKVLRLAPYIIIII